MASRNQSDSIEIVRMANGYMVRPPHNFRSGDVACLQDCYVFNDFDEAAVKALELIGTVEKTA